MINFRLIARLDIKMNNLIKGVQMEGWRKIGDPKVFAEKYALEGADELMLTDVVASLYGRNSLHAMVETVASNIFIPMTVGGGIRNTEDVQKLLDCGADKVAINTSATQFPSLVDQVSQSFGSQACVIAIEVMEIDGSWMVMTDNGRNNTGKLAVPWSKEVADRGAGELIVTAIHKEGMGLGMDLKLIGNISDEVDIPVVAGGGIGNLTHLSELISKTNASGVALAQALHWGKLTLDDIRKTLDAAGVFVRPIT
ncbi:imidazole glycerol phosphate synthase cyclase subunit [Amylibacter sp.]|nr:imidazole glycerol phosphate synthase cyclase subunit [Amylibacter sp.]MDC1414274.1 imidazole glycerol phosphate synthase cyclase subunit [Amylibacter sp.]